MEKISAYFLLGLTFAIPSGYGLYRVIFFSLPLLKERWYFFVLLILFATGINLPIIALLNRYFFAEKRIYPRTIVRESIGSALLIAILIWFQIGRALNSAIIFLCVGAFLAGELILRIRETTDKKLE